jgi:16S rRNA (guanine527-N7)-methyltransferase|tara:strand:- start:2106 stop:2726 length:621 start_codon:yes stop_codon:yes gene_type:complete
LDLLEQYFPHLSYEQIEQFSQLNILFKNLNTKINLVSRKDIDFLFERHIIHSLGIAKFLKFKNKTEILDLGTGGGFPGIPLSIVFPNVKFYLIDSIGKKIDAVIKITKALGLKNIIALKVRAEDYDQKVDFVVSRAVMRMERFVPIVSKNIKLKSFNNIKNGIISLKGGDLSKELSNFSEAKQVNLSNYFETQFFKTKKIVYIPFN